MLLYPLSCVSSLICEHHMLVLLQACINSDLCLRRSEQLEKQHQIEMINQFEYSKRTERELRKKHLLELKQHPKNLRVCCMYVVKE